MKKFSNEKITEHLSANLSNWKFEDRVIKRDFKFKTFVDAFSFMTTVAFEAEKMDHHPEWTNVYNTVNVRLNTHSENGITHLDFDLAGKIDNAWKLYDTEKT